MEIIQLSRQLGEALRNSEEFAKYQAARDKCRENHELEEKITWLLDDMSSNMYKTALERRENLTYEAVDLDELKKIADNKPGFIKALWCEDRECEGKLKEVAGVTSRCMPLGMQDGIDGKCVCCGKPAKKLVYWGKAY